MSRTIKEIYAPGMGAGDVGISAVRDESPPRHESEFQVWQVWSRSDVDVVHVGNATHAKELGEALIELAEQGGDE